MSSQGPSPFAEDGAHMVDMRLGRIVIRENADQQWIFLVERGGPRGFPIVIGSNEAYEIQRVVTDTKLERPLTHQLTYTAIQAMGGEVRRVDIVDLRSNTFFAQMVVAQTTESGEATLILDARPSDALALGLRAGCPIRVAESVLEQVRTDKGGPDVLPADAPDPDDPAPPGEADEPELE